MRKEKYNYTAVCGIIKKIQNTMYKVPDGVMLRYMDLLRMYTQQRADSQNNNVL